MKECWGIMEWIEKGKCMRSNKGATTIVVICIMAVIMTLSMGLFLTASMLIKTSGRTLASEQCRILALSFSRELEAELCSEEYRYEDIGQEQAAKLSEAEGQTLWHYLRQNISDGSWPYYRESEGGIHSSEQAVRSFTLKKTGTTGEIADIMLTIYWTPSAQQEIESRLPERLVIKTRAEVKEQACIMTDVYEVQAKELSDYQSWSIRHVERK